MERNRRFRKRHNKTKTQPRLRPGVPEPGKSRPKLFPIVGVGASAGGLEAFTELLKHLPGDTGMSFVLVQHLAPNHESALGGLLSRHTNMPVTEVRDGMVIAPDHVYVIPPNTNMTVLHGHLHLIPRPETATHMPIDFFLKGLAQDRQDRAIGVILSGLATDGTLGLKAIKAAGGITFAQDEKSAKYDSMPRSATASGAADFILPPEGIAKELARIGRHPDLTHQSPAKVVELLPSDQTDREKLLTLLKVRTGVDFSHYRSATINRRIQRRMLLKRIETLHAYIQYMRENPAECDALYEDILIRVTSFFRDPQTFEALKKEVYPILLKNRDRKLPVRLWVPGCSTGEDAYSLIISLVEYLDGVAPGVPIQAFATDIHEKAIATARQGIYRENIAAHVSSERLRRFFTKTDHGYQINKSIRDSIVFARHDVTRDPPYSRLDIVSCRNVLIFLGAALQKTVFGTFHYALNSRGFLVLGRSETAGKFSDYFAVVDRKNKIYAKRMSAARLAVAFASSADLAWGSMTAEPQHPPRRNVDVSREADRILMDRYTPPGVLVNEDLEVLDFRGYTGPYLDPTPGVATLSLMKIARGDLLYELRNTLQKAKKTNEPVRIDGIKVKFDGQPRRVNLQIIPIGGGATGQRHFLVLFEDPGGPRPEGARAVESAPRDKKPSTEATKINRLEEELKTAKESLQASREDQAEANEELRTSNEEFLSAYEELETAKEELQSTNEELTNLNEELQNRNQELTKLGNDLRNILNSVYDCVAVVDSDLRLRFFDARAGNILNLIPADVGRSIGDIKPGLDVHDMGKQIARVIADSTSASLEARTTEGAWYQVRIQPYMTPEKGVEGAVIALADITERQRKQAALNMTQTMFEDLFEASPDAIVTVGGSGGIFRVNVMAEKMFSYTRDELAGQPVEVLIPQRFRELHLFKRREYLADPRMRPMGAGMDLYAQRKDGTEFPVEILLSPSDTTLGRQTLAIIRDITKRKEAEKVTRDLSLRRIQVQDEERQRVSRELHDTTGPNLSALVMNLALAEKSARELKPAVRKPLRESVALARRCVSDVRTMAYQLHPPLLDEVGLTAALNWYIQSFSGLSGIKVRSRLSDEVGRLPKDAEVSLFRIVQAALSNVQRHSNSREAEVKLALNTDAVTLQVKDRGTGMAGGAPEGLGLRGIRERVQLLKGRFDIASGKSGTTLSVTIPVWQLRTGTGEKGVPNHEVDSSPRRR